MSSNHLDLRSVWKSLVASCMCVAEVQTFVFNAFISSTKVFVSNVKHIRLQPKVFVSSTIIYSFSI